MINRTVTVRLRADISDYTRGMQRASTNTARLANAGGLASTVLVAGFAASAASAAKFDKALSNVRAVTGATGAELEKLRAAALEAGRTTAFSAYEAADAEAELARAGVEVADIVGGALKGSLSLAAAGQVSLSEAAVVSAQAMNTFGLAGKDVSHVADLLAAGANKSAADVHGLGMSLRMGGLLAHQTGLSIEDTVGTLAAFADHALIGSDAGTSLKVMLQRLVPQSKEAQGMMDAIGFSAYDANGRFVGLTEMAGRMKTSFSKLTPEARNAAMATIFGADAVRSATILYGLGAEGITEYIRAVDDQGAANRMASVQMDNLIGDLHKLKGALEVALIEGGTAAQGALRGMTQWVTRLVNAYNALSPEMQHAITLTTGITGSVGLAAAVFLLMLPRIHATRIAMRSLGITAATTRAALMGVGRLGILVAGFAAAGLAARTLMAQFKEAPPNVNAMTNAMIDFAQRGRIAGEMSKTFGEDLDGIGEAAARIAHPGALERVGDALYNIIHLGMADDAGLEDAREKIKAIDESLAGLVQSGRADIAAESFRAFAAEAEKAGTSTEKFRTLLPQYGEALTSLDSQQKMTAGGQQDLAAAAEMSAAELKEERTEAEKLADALKVLNGATIGAAEREIGFRQSLADLTDTVKENGHSLDVTSEKGRAVKSAFLEAAQAAMEHAEAVTAQTGSMETGQAILAQDIALLREQMGAAGFSKDAIEKLIGAYAKLPPLVQTKVSAPGAARATGEIDRLRKEVGALPPGETITIKAPTGDAIKSLKAAGYEVEKIPKSKNVRITAPTGDAVANAQNLQRALDSLRDRTVRITTISYSKFVNTDAAPKGQNPWAVPRAAGGPVRGYAAGGHLQMFPGGGLIKGPGTPTSDSILGVFGSGARARVSDTEYVIRAASVRKYGVGLFDALNRGTVPALAGGGAAGGFAYSPTGMATFGSAGDPKSRYDDLVGRLKDAWTEYRKAVSELNAVRRDKKSTKGERNAAAKAVAEQYALIKGLDKALGLPSGAQAPGTFRLDLYQKQLNRSVAATDRWRQNLTKIGKRGGEEVRALLEGMGEQGYALVTSLAGASDKQFKDITAKLLNLSGTAKATLADFTAQLNASTKESQQFAADLQTLAARGFGDLAQALAAQGDASAMQLARQAASGGSKDVAAANAAVGKANTALTGEDLTNALVLLSTLRGGTGRGFAELIAAGLSVGTIRALVPKILGQINSLPEAHKGRFLQQFAGQSGVTAMARGGILSGPGLVLGGEAGVPESWIPIDGSARSRALLAATNRLMGYRAVPAGRFGPGTAGPPVVQHVTKNITVQLIGAKQSSAEQAADVARHLNFVG